MSKQFVHKDGSEYPDHFATTKKLTRTIALHLAPHVLSKDEVLQRKDIFARLDQYHHNLTNNHFDTDWGKVMKTVVGDSSYFEAVEGHGLYKYIGPSVDDIFVAETPLSHAITVEEKIEYTADEILVGSSSGSESLYVWWHIDSEELAKMKSENKWAMKIGRHNTPNVGTRFSQYRVAIPHNIRLGLVVSCQNAAVLEKAVHVTLTNRDSKIDEEGNEWYLTNVDEVKEILQFHFLV